MDILLLDHPRVRHRDKRPPSAGMLPESIIPDDFDNPLAERLTVCNCTKDFNIDRISPHYHRRAFHRGVLSP